MVDDDRDADVPPTASEADDDPGGYDRILKGCRQGDSTAQRQLVERSADRVYGLVTRLVGTQEADDVTQQVFLQLFRKLDQFAGRSRFETWLYRLAINEAWQYLRKARRWQHQVLPAEPMEVEPSRGQAGEQRELLDLALQRVDPDLRTIFVLREVDGLSYAQLAEVLDIPSGTVGSRLNRARQELQKQLRLLGWDP